MRWQSTSDRELERDPQPPDEPLDLPPCDSDCDNCRKPIWEACPDALPDNKAEE